MDFLNSAASPVRKVSRQLMRFAGAALVLAATVVPAAQAQLNCASTLSAAGKMSCLIPATATPSGYKFLSASSGNTQLSNSFGFLTADMGGEISQIPLASPASGIIFTTDPTLNVPVPSDQSLGPILTQRADTIGRHKFYFATTYQYFLLEDVDGLSLKSLPSSVFFFQSPGATGSTPDTVGVANSRIDLKIQQFVGYLTYGLTDRIDVSAAIPVLRVDMRYTVNEQFYSLNNGQQVLPNPLGNGGIASNAQQSTGVGDIILAVKGNIWKPKSGGGVSVGAEIRLPTGDALNFLGSGTIGIKPFVAYTYSGRVSPHFDIGYQVNGNTPLVQVPPNSNFTVDGQLPNRLYYSGGADWRVFSRLTIAADVLGEHVFDAQRASIATNVPIVNPGSGGVALAVPTALTSTMGSYNRTDGSAGLKIKAVGNLLLTGNLIVALDHTGLRERLAPMFGASYTF